MTLSTLSWALVVAVVLFELMTRFALFRLFWRNVFRFFAVMEIGALKLVRWIYPPKYVLVGHCQKRGTCCEMILGDPPRMVKNSPRLINLFAAYHRVVHNFHVVARGDNDELVFKCGYLQSDGRCGVYRYRQLLCRNYPLIPWFVPPSPIPGCGLKVAPKVVTRMKTRASLPILNPIIAIYHPTRPGGRKTLEHSDHYQLVDISESEPWTGE